MTISIQDVEYVAKLAKLNFTEEEKVIYQEKLDAILGYMEQLQELDTKDIEPTTHVLPLENVFREDKVGVCLSNQEALANAPDQKDGYFKVPKII
ncbi:MAG: Asp-tRNA(Asn)/Glu-tRNA(Gln) amidotransferase subunit GatC [Bacillota bacterium]|jgi:aspartyl-tRNA(Asn)/glutamyl-tRNA(Gln) amidotransferase subunit C